MTLLGKSGHMSTGQYEVVNERVTQALDYSGGTNAIYIGEAAPGSGKAEAKWSIKKLTYDVNNNITDIQWASGNAQADKVWNSRTGYTFS